MSQRPNNYAEAIKKIQQKCPVGFDVPVRDHTADNPLEANTEWRARGAITNEFYNQMNLAYLIGKSKKHARGSLEAALEKTFKTWEMEATNKANIRDWKSVDQDNYKVTIGHLNVSGCPNNIKWHNPVTGQDAVALGNYNLMLQKCPAYKYRNVTPQDAHFEDSQDLFRHGFTNFPWELLEAQKLNDTDVTFSFRHWGYWAGKGSIKKVDLVGKVKAKLDPSNGKIIDLEILADTNKFLDETVLGKPKSEGDAEYPSALALTLGKNDVHELTDLFIPKGKTVETI